MQEYVVLALGLTTILAPVWPVLHEYEPAPTAVSVAELPAQMEEDDALILTLGAALTNTVTDATAEQPLELVPVTEYVVVTLGDTTMLALV